MGKTGEGMEALVRRKAYGFADRKGNENSTYPAIEAATLRQGLWYVEVTVEMSLLTVSV